MMPLLLKTSMVSFFLTIEKRKKRLGHPGTRLGSTRVPDFSSQGWVTDRLLACLPSILLYWHRFHVDGERIDTETDDDSISGHFLRMLHDKPPSELHRQSLDTTLILYAEHEFNASTFTARVITGTLSDIHSAVTGAIGALRGTLHGGANEAAMELISLYDNPEKAVCGIREKLARKDKGLLEK